MLHQCSRTVNPRLFALAVGGYGLFGAVATVTLRLARRHKVERRVSIVDIDDLPALFELRVREGYEFGDCQFATDPASREFLRAGVFSCYRPVAIDVPIPDGQRSLAPHEWRRLLRLAHTSKSQAFAEYARYYMATDGQLYWTDTHQLSDYPDGYHADLDRELGAAVKGSEMITELYVPRPALPEFMRSVRADARQHGTDIIYGTIRIIEEDDQTVLAWARQRWACIVFNLHVDHSPEGIATAAGHFRRLIDRAIELGGSYYLTYHRWATAEQALACHPRLPRVHRRETPARSRRRVLERLVHASRTAARRWVDAAVVESWIGSRALSPSAGRLRLSCVIARVSSQDVACASDRGRSGTRGADGGALPRARGRRGHRRRGARSRRRPRAHGARLREEAARRGRRGPDRGRARTSW